MRVRRACAIASSKHWKVLLLVFLFSCSRTFLVHIHFETKGLCVQPFQHGRKGRVVYSRDCTLYELLLWGTVHCYGEQLILKCLLILLHYFGEQI
uniref:Putative secreted protein n=1 Tax=Ixodes ricinus TaxID=34613 RepID=A0A6B0UHL9_IXORI